MSTYPTSPRADFLKWCEVHATVFLKEPGAIGLSPAQAVEFETLTIKAAEALVAQGIAQQAARVATQQVSDAFAALLAGSGDAVRSIRAYAETTAAPNAVYSAAQIDPPADPSPVPPPDKPHRLAVTLEAATGALTIAWKASNPRQTGGTTYVIQRRLPGETAFAFLGVTGEKRFVDASLPAGVEQVEYVVQGRRGRSAGPRSEILLVTIGAEKRQNAKTSKSQNLSAESLRAGMRGTAVMA